MRDLSKVLVLLSACGLAACLRPDPSPRFTPAWETPDLDGPGWTRSRAALVLSDCQFHNLLSRPLPERNLTAEAAAATAIRPPQLDLFAPEVLDWILREGAPEAELILHLGDACDLACEGEFVDFVAAMEGGGRPWFMAPGNHDFFYFGSYDPSDPGLWDDACFHSGARLPKDRFVRLYVAALLRQAGADFEGLAGALGLADQRGAPLAELAGLVPDAFAWQAPAGEPGLLHAIEWRIDRAAPWRSFVVQAVDLTDRSVPDPVLEVHALLLDSCQYQRRPGLIPNGWQSWPLALNVGFTAEMLPDQLRVLRRWIDTAPAGRSFMMMSHHPFDDYAPRTRASVGWLWRESPVGLLVTGHTHAGYFAYHDLGGAEDELELNLGSTTDWPMEWRVLSAHVHLERREVYLRTARRTLVEELRARGGFFEIGWEVPLDAPDDYRQYKVGRAGTDLLFDFYLAHHLVPPWLPPPRVVANDAAKATEAQVKDTLLWTYLRLLSTFPTDPAAGGPRWPAGCADDAAVVERICRAAAAGTEFDQKVELLAELAQFERSRASRDPATGAPTDAARRRFKISQAAWASRYEGAAGRRLRVEDDLVRFDFERRTGQR
jgi:hypothetical protein